MAQCDNKNSIDHGDGEEMLCDNPISLDEIEDGLWLGNVIPHIIYSFIHISSYQIYIYCEYIVVYVCRFCNRRLLFCKCLWYAYISYMYIQYTYSYFIDIKFLISVLECVCVCVARVRKGINLPECATQNHHHYHDNRLYIYHCRFEAAAPYMMELELCTLEQNRSQLHSLVRHFLCGQFLQFNGLPIEICSHRSLQPIRKALLHALTTTMFLPIWGNQDEKALIYNNIIFFYHNASIHSHDIKHDNMSLCASASVFCVVLMNAKDKDHMYIYIHSLNKNQLFKQHPTGSKSKIL